MTLIRLVYLSRMILIMIGLDTNVLARYYIDDESDAEATKQHLLAKKLIESGKPLFVSKTVMLELEWVTY